MIRTITDRFAPSQTDSHFRRPFRTSGNHFAPLPTPSHVYQPLRTSGDRFAPLATFPLRLQAVWRRKDIPTRAVPGQIHKRMFMMRYLLLSTDLSTFGFAPSATPSHLWRPIFAPSESGVSHLSRPIFAPSATSGHPNRLIWC
jgi:hypothetical protein